MKKKYVVALSQPGTNRFWIYRGRDRRRFKKWLRKRKEKGIKLEIIEANISDERVGIRSSRHRAQGYRESKQAVYSGKSLVFRGRDHRLDGSKARPLEVAKWTL